MPDPQSRRARRERQAQEVEASQQRLRDNIADAKRLLDDTAEMLKRHRRECEESDD